MSPKKDRLEGFADRLAGYRKIRDFTLEGLAEEIGSSKANVGHWEEGIREPSLVMVCRLAKALRVSTDRLLGVKRP